MTTRRRKQNHESTNESSQIEQKSEEQDTITKGLFIRNKENTPEQTPILPSGEVTVPQISHVHHITNDDTPKTKTPVQHETPVQNETRQHHTTQKKQRSGALTEIEDLTPEDFEKMLLSSTPMSFRIGQFVSGQITKIVDQSAFVDIGGKSEGILLEMHTDPQILPFHMGQEIEAFVLSMRNNEILLANQIQHGGYEELKMAYELKRTVELQITNANKGGFILKGFDSTGFCPFSQFDFSTPKDPNALIGEKFDFRITQLGDEFSASRKILLEEEEEKIRTQTLSTLQEGDSVEGTVLSIHPFGAFVDVQGIQALCPKRFFRRVQGGVQEGLLLQFEIDNIDSEGKILVRPQFQDPWLTASEKYIVGEKYSGTIRSTTDFGFFVALEFGIEGLAHKDQNASLWTQKPDINTTVELYISRIDPEARKLSLSSTPPVEYSQKHNEGRIVREEDLGPTLGDLFSEAKQRKQKKKHRK